MNRREQLEENYADSLFTLLMDHVAEVQGNQALEENRRLREDPDAEVPRKSAVPALKPSTGPSERKTPGPPAGPR